MKTELLIEYYDPATETFVGEIDISAYDLATINRICPPQIEDDFTYCDSAFVEKEMFPALQSYILELSGFVYETYIYNIITRRVD